MQDSIIFASAQLFSNPAPTPPPPYRNDDATTEHSEGKEQLVRQRNYILENLGKKVFGGLENSNVLVLTPQTTYWSFL